MYFLWNLKAVAMFVQERTVKNRRIVLLFRLWLCVTRVGNTMTGTLFNYTQKSYPFHPFPIYLASSMELLTGWTESSRRFILLCWWPLNKHSGISAWVVVTSGTLLSLWLHLVVDVVGFYFFSTEPVFRQYSIKFECRTTKLLIGTYLIKVWYVMTLWMSLAIDLTWLWRHIHRNSPRK